VQPSPLPEPARRFLQPLVGIDPGGVRVHRGVLADQVASAYAADAVTIGEDVALAAGHEDSAPETLGLLAHELTHVARQRDPRFVPPAIDSARAPDGDTLYPVPPTTGDEEALAQRVEVQVAQVARVQVNQSGTPQPAAVREAIKEMPQHAAPAYAASPDHRSLTADPAPAGPAARPWGNLPAPWEPLPVWDSVPEAPAATQVAPRPHVEPSAAVAAPVVQRAARNRVLDEAAPLPTVEPAPVEQAPEPDLDALAHQVYAVLKRRLAAERRRGA
ncbi:MAG TPA: DUF4157 domain-containing protein, partial [Roseiflexaceae bacterium]